MMTAPYNVNGVFLAHDTEGTWPWDASKARPGYWCKVSEEHHDYCLNVLPPIMLRGVGFAVSEPIRFDPGTGEDVYLCLMFYLGSWFARECTLRQAARDGARIRGGLVGSMKGGA